MGFVLYLQGLLDKGITCLAVLFLHSYTFPEHEQVRMGPVVKKIISASDDCEIHVHQMNIFPVSKELFLS